MFESVPTRPWALDSWFFMIFADAVCPRMYIRINQYCCWQNPNYLGHVLVL